MAPGATPATQAAQEAQEELTCAVKPQCEDSKLLNYMLVALLTWGLVRLWDWARRPRKVQEQVEARGRLRRRDEEEEEEDDERRSKKRRYMAS